MLLNKPISEKYIFKQKSSVGSYLHTLLNVPELAECSDSAFLESQYIFHYSMMRLVQFGVCHYTIFFLNFKLFFLLLVAPVAAYFFVSRRY